jgi:hypothetical protein
MHGRRGNRSGLHFAVRGQHLLDRAEGLTVELARDRIGAIDIRVDNTHKANGVALKFKFLVHSGMVASENARAHDCDTDRILHWQEKTPLADCRNEIVNGK